MTRVLLLHPSYRTDPGISNGLTSISAYLKRTHHEVRLLVLDENLTNLELPWVPDIIGFSVTAPQRQMAQVWAKIMRVTYPEAFIVMGGADVTLEPSAYWPFEVDALCIGEGEEAMVSLCATKPKDLLRKLIPPASNLWIRGGKRPVKCAMTDLSKSPPEDLLLYPWAEMAERRNGWIGEFFTGRGCPYQCTYCSNSALVKAMGTTPKEYVRFKPIENVIKELRMGIFYADNAKMVVFGDDTFILDPGHLEQFLVAYRQNIFLEFNLPFVCNIRPELFTPDIARLLKAAGCAQVKVGVESGNAALRTQVLNRHMPQQAIEAAFELAREVGLQTSAFMMIGLPGEKVAMMDESLQFLARVQPDRFKYSIYYPFPGTPLYEKSQDLIVESRLRPLTNYYTETPLFLPKAEQARLSTIMANVGQAVNDMAGKTLYETKHRSYMAVKVG